ncbi:MAG: galactosyltransferase-related protein [Planctomycetota bacterium]
MLRRTLRDWSFSLARDVCFSDRPQVSFVIPHRGSDRQSLLELTIRSIASLEGDVECIVVEQDRNQCLRDLPGNTLHTHLPHPSGDQRWHKCYAFNEGAKLARGRIVVCHDGDLLMPQRYLDVIVEHLMRREQDVVYPQRFLYYLSEGTTQRLIAEQSTEPLLQETPVMVKQNWTGGTLAITKDAFERVGGFDESFTGWTGEDREFYDRCHALNGWFFGYVPFLHLWHPPQSGRVDSEARRKANEFTQQKLAIDRAERIRLLNDSRLTEST